MGKAAFRWIYLLFFLSGFPALIYQIVWQRTLFGIFGVNILSVTVVVSAFMLGLGLGSLAGGRLSNKPAAPLLLLFGAMELGIAVYGVISLRLFHWVAAFTAGAPALETGVISFSLVLVPTVLMGATLPLLVAHLVKLSGNVGRSVGILYFLNTLGSAVACFVVALFTMRRLGMSRSVAVAAALNTLVGLTVIVMHFRWPGPAAAVTEQRTETPKSALTLSFSVALILAGLTGFISLCYEIVWVRVYSFVTGGDPKTLAFVLGTFLVGIAFGSVLTRRLCNRAAANLAPFARLIAALVLLANLLGFAIVPLVALLVQRVDYLWTLPLVCIAAGMLGATFPLLCHISVRADARAGASVSYLYLGNIAGSVLGSWLVGFLLLDIWPLRGISVLLALLGVAVAFALACAGRLAVSGKAMMAVLGVSVCAAVVLSSGPLFANAYERLQPKDTSVQNPGTHLKDIVETRSGIVTVDENGTIFGGGIYDGQLITDIHQSDTLVFPLSLSLFHPEPKEVLIIGMSGGAWSEVIANHPQVESVLIVEINPGYVEVIRRYPQVAPLLQNPKVKLVYDDGRRWMVNNRYRKFDMIVMDTTFHWRAHSTNLLSVEFLNLARQLLKPGGVLYYNTTFSWEAERTAALSFPHAFRFGTMTAVSDSKIRIDKARWRNILLRYRLEGKPILNLALEGDRKVLNEFLENADTLPGNSYADDGMETRENILRRTSGKQIVTDDNMATEWREVIR
jgi:spermidine synthase